jgi:hypothetical protein
MAAATAETGPKAHRLIENGLQFSLLLLAFAAPISIAGTQTAWGLAILFWLLRLIYVRPGFRSSGFELAVIAFVGLTLLSSALSYEPGVSLRKMASVSLVTIVYLVSQNITSRPQLFRVIIAILVGGVIAAGYAFAVQIIGKSLKVIQLTADSPLRDAGVAEGYTILKANGVDINSPPALEAAIRERSVDGIALITVYRHELIDTYKVPVSRFAAGVEGLGITEWSRGHDTRATGFYGHFITFAEVLQLIASLGLGLLIAASGRKLLLWLALVAYAGALFLTITRASWLAFGVSAALMVLIGASRRTVIICVAIAIPLAVAGLFYLQQKRQVGFFDAKDESTSWRLMVWREGFDLLTSSPRHLAVGIGLDSIKNHYLEWHMFDDGKQPIGHMHSDYLQLALERGVPTLIVWLIWMALYLRLLWRGLSSKKLDWLSRGILLGALGGTVGFLISGFVQYNWGDSEVVMIFYLLMGASLAIVRNPNIISQPQTA